MKKGLVFRCFSPPIMVATFTLEILFAVYHVWRYKMNVAIRLVVATLVFLGLFQIAEYFVCGGLGMSHSTWSRIGYASITTLPPIGLHLVHVIAKKTGRTLTWISYASGIAFVVYFLAYSGAFQGYECTGNYVIFQLGDNPSLFYGAYYYGWLAVTIGLALRWRMSKIISAVRKNALKWMLIGYGVFLIPTAIANTVKVESRDGVPSVMCGFAILYAIILTVKVVPTLTTKKDLRV